MDGLHNGAARSKFRVHALAREVSQNLKSLTQRSKEAIKAGPLRWAVVDSVGGTKPANPYVRAWAPLRSVTRSRALFLCWCGRSGGAPASASASMTATDGPLARLTIERHPALTPRWEARGSMFRWTFDVVRSGYSSLPLRPGCPLFPNLLVTGVLVRACLGTCVLQLTSLLATQRPDRDSSQITPARTLPSLVLRVRNHTQTHLHIHTNQITEADRTMVQIPPPVSRFPQGKPRISIRDSLQL